jgi:hypothetical protein
LNQIQDWNEWIHLHFHLFSFNQLWIHAVLKLFVYHIFHIACRFLDSEGEILKRIEVQAEKSKPITRTNLRPCCKAEHSRSLCRGWVNFCTLYHRGHVAEAKVHPRQSPGNETIGRLRECLQGMKWQWFFNLDEVAISKCEDRKDKKVIIPTRMDGRTIYHCGSRNVKYISIIT